METVAYKHACVVVVIVEIVLLVPIKQIVNVNSVLVGVPLISCYKIASDPC